ncbi:hypothetical protein BDY19DRAFT_948922 [Irpex rosettiformis]|uniref:Uncharacterized protein n=1 Tax=Irpex rosettiformis TaxID=378272 RepID=A0ACB8U3H3_9APHY|nr:hypothetical protein BDY19DRAFT_948922 [Irpex rosettiformis]
MDYDRKSGTSSFYGNRRSSYDALNRDFPAPQFPEADRARHDSTSTFNNPNGPTRESAEGYANFPSPGYNPSSFMAPARSEPLKGGYDEEAYHDEPFDIYADFNNQGPRYSKAVFTPDDGYRPVGSPSLLKMEDTPNGAGPVEMVTVPALGPEWKAEEVGANRKRVIKEANAERRAQKWKEWRRGERGLCGRYFTRKFLAWFLFAFCVAVGIVLAFVIPRIPDFQFNLDNPIAAASSDFNKTVPTYFNRAPTNFSFPGSAQLQLDTGSNFIPIHMKNIDADVYDLQTNMHIGEGHIDSLVLPAKKFIPIQLPLNFSYVATNTSDQTWNNWYNGCKNSANYADGKRPTISFRLLVGFHIDGLIGTKHTAANVATANCPVELTENSA